jgi:hypothetical protein
MKLRVMWMLLAAGLLTDGCALFHHHHKPKPVQPMVVAPAPIVTPDTSLAAKVISYNSVGQFVVLSFPMGQMPKMNQTLFLYRAGLKVGEIKITGPQNDNNIVADLINGEAQNGDEVREQ